MSLDYYLILLNNVELSMVIFRTLSEESFMNKYSIHPHICKLQGLYYIRLNNMYSQSMLFPHEKAFSYARAAKNVILGWYERENVILGWYERENLSNKTRVTLDSRLQWGRVTLHIKASQRYSSTPPTHCDFHSHKNILC